MVDRTKPGWFLREHMAKNPSNTREARELKQMMDERDSVGHAMGPEFEFDDLH